MTAQCYATNKLKYQYANFVDTNDQDNMAAQHYGFARIQLTTPNGGWKRPSKLIYESLLKLALFNFNELGFSWLNNFLECFRGSGRRMFNDLGKSVGRL